MTSDTIDAWYTYLYRKTRPSDNIKYTEKYPSPLGEKIFFKVVENS